MSRCSYHPGNQPPNQSPPLGSRSFSVTKHTSGPGVVLTLQAPCEGVPVHFVEEASDANVLWFSYLVGDGAGI